MKKLFSALLAAMMVIALAVTAFAADNGSITVEKTVKDQTYTVYRMATLDDVDVNKDAYLYTAVEPWEDFFVVDNSEYFQINDHGNIIFNDNMDASTVAAFAKDALAYAKANGVSPATDAKTATVDNEEIVFDNLGLGYYLVDSSLGAFCALTTNDPDATVEEKNAAPTIDKFVEEDSLVNDGIDGNEWVKTNDADLFQSINYKTIVTVKKGAVGYVLHDKMEAGLTWSGTVAVKVDGVDVAAENYTLVAETTDKCTFDIKFEDAYVESLADGTEIEVTYSFIVNENAEIYTETNDNETWLKYGDASETTHITTETKVYKFGFVKTDADGNVLDGAKFKLYDAAIDGAEIAVVKVSDGVYRLAKANETGVEIETKDGIATIIGLDGNKTKYFIEETEAPAGYNKMTTRQEVTIDGENLDVTVNDGVYADGIQIINQTGIELPGTGSLGTTVFIIIGGAIVLGAGVLLFAKKRMSQIAE